MGYSTIDNMIYGIAYGGSGTSKVEELVRIDAAGKTTYYPIQNSCGIGTAGTFSATNFVVGAINNGYLYITDNNDVTYMYVIDINPSDANFGYLLNPATLQPLSNCAGTAIDLNQANPTANNNAAGFNDWVYNAANNTLMGITYAEQIVAVYATGSNAGQIASQTTLLAGSPMMQTYTVASKATPEAAFGSLFYDANDDIFAFGNATGNLYEVNPTMGANTLVATFVPSSSNDGASLSHCGYCNADNRLAANRAAAGK